jgi:hypothetical protein
MAGLVSHQVGSGIWAHIHEFSSPKRLWRQHRRLRILSANLDEFQVIRDSTRASFNQQIDCLRSERKLKDQVTAMLSQPATRSGNTCPAFSIIARLHRAL